MVDDNDIKFGKSSLKDISRNLVQFLAIFVLLFRIDVLDISAVLRYDIKSGSMRQRHAYVLMRKKKNIIRDEMTGGDKREYV